MSFSVRINGNKITQKLFAKLPDKVARKVVRKAINAASQKVVSAVRKSVPVEEGNLQLSIAKKTITYKQEEVIVGIVGSDKAKEGARYLHLIENGHLTIDGKFIPGKFPLRKAFDATAAARAEAFGKKLGKEVEKEAKKLGAK